MESQTKSFLSDTAPEIKLIYKTKVKASQRPQVSSSKDAARILLEGWDQNLLGFIEQFKVMLLNNASRVLGIFEVSTGGISSTVVDVKLIFIAALKVGASRIILSHNHPSCRLTPSGADKALTTKIKEAGRILEIQVIDHVIVSEEGYYSFADAGEI